MLLIEKKLDDTVDMERFITRGRNKLKFHYEKWEPLLPLVTQ